RGAGALRSRSRPDRDLPRRSHWLERIPERDAVRACCPADQPGRGIAFPDRTDHLALARRVDGDDPPRLPAGTLAPVRSDHARELRAGWGWPVSHLARAGAMGSRGAPSLPCGRGGVRYARAFADRRRIGDEQKSRNRLYVVESAPTLTGTKADHRLPVRAAEVAAVAGQLAAAVGAGSAGQGGSAPAGSERWIAAVAKDLQASRGRSVVVAGEYQPAAVHAVAQAMNQALGNVGTTVTYGVALEASSQEAASSLADLVTAIDGGSVELLVMLGGNPVFTAPSDFRFAEKLAKVPLAVYHGLYADETAYLSHWHVPEAHALESWGDVRAYDGTVTLMQPLIAPLYEGRTAHELLA